MPAPRKKLPPIGSFRRPRLFGPGEGQVERRERLLPQTARNEAPRRITIQMRPWHFFSGKGGLVHLEPKRHVPDNELFAFIGRVAEHCTVRKSPEPDAIDFFASSDLKRFFIRISRPTKEGDAAKLGAVGLPASGWIKNGIKKNYFLPYARKQTKKK